MKMADESQNSGGIQVGGLEDETKSGKPNGDPTSTHTTSADSVNSSTRVIPSQLKDKFHEHELDENEKIIDTVATKIGVAVGDDLKKESEMNERDEFRPLSPFESFLNETNLTKKQFMMFVVFFVLLLMAIIVSFYFLISLFGSEPKEVTSSEVVVEETVEKSNFLTKLFGENKVAKTDESDGTPEVEKKSNDDETVEKKTEVTDTAEVKKSEDKNATESVSEKVVETPAVEIGKVLAPTFKSNTIRVAQKIGFGETVEDRLSYYVRTYRKSRNIFNTDLFDYLAAVPDRKAGYDQFLIQFKGSFEELKLAHEDLRQEIAQYQNRLSVLTEQTSQIENKFFDELDNLQSENLPETLQAFQDLTAKKNLILSELKAHEAVEVKYSKAIPLIQSKITAIVANEDPFVKGVKVVDFRQVDLDLIIKGVN